MTKYLISFPAPAMDVLDEDMAAVGEAAHAVIREAKDAGVYVFGGGINEDVAALLVAADGSATHETLLGPQASLLFGQAFDHRSSAQSVLQQSFLLDRRHGELSRQGFELRRQGSALLGPAKKPGPPAFFLDVQSIEACTARL
jgi:hypothetical protein